MHLPLVVVGLLLFATMLSPLPAAAGIAIALWALHAGVPLPALAGMYLLQDVLTYTAIGRLLPRLTGRVSRRTNVWLERVPARVRGPLGLMLRPAAGGSGLFSAALISFYAAAGLAVLRNRSPFRSAAIVIGTDMAKYFNGLAVALGFTFVLPSSPYTVPIASVVAMAAFPLLKLLATRARPVLALQPIRNR